MCGKPHIGSHVKKMWEQQNSCVEGGQTLDLANPAKPCRGENTAESG